MPLGGMGENQGIPWSIHRMEKDMIDGMEESGEGLREADSRILIRLFRDEGNGKVCSLSMAYSIRAN